MTRLLTIVGLLAATAAIFFLVPTHHTPDRLFGADSGFKSPATSGDDATVGTLGPWSSTDNIFASDDVRASLGAGTLCVHKLTSLKMIKGGSITGNEKAADEIFNTLDTTLTYGGAADLWGVALTDTDVNASTFGFGAAVKSNTGTITHYITATNFSFGVPAGATINGVEVTVEGGCSTATARVDYMSMKVYYTAAVAAGATLQHAAVQFPQGITTFMRGTLTI